MEYTIKEIGDLAGVTTRTLRYYDEIGLLKPAKINAAGYRIYTEYEINRLQQILFYRELEISLNQIKEILDAPTFNEVGALMAHRQNLIEKRNQLDQLIKTVNKTIDTKEGKIKMTNQEKFEGFKKEMIEENEKKYGKEIREKYGAEAVQKSNEKVMGLSKEAYEEVTELSNKLTETLQEAFKTGDPSSKIAQEAADLHKKWLSYYWNGYSKEAHANLAQMYVADERFKAYYDKEQEGTAEFLRDAIHIYTKFNDKND